MTSVLPHLVGGLAVLMWAAGCDRDVGDLEIFFTKSAAVNQDPLDPERVAALQIRVEGPDMEVVTVDAEFTAGGETALPPIPVGPNRVITVEALTEGGGRVVSRARSQPFSVLPGINEMHLFLGLVSQFSLAAGNGMADPGGDLQLAPFPDGDIAMVGGRRHRDAVGFESAVERLQAFDPQAARARIVGECGSALTPCLVKPRWHHQVHAGEKAIYVVGGEDIQGLYEEVEKCTEEGCEIVNDEYIGFRHMAKARGEGGATFFVGGDDRQTVSARVWLIDAGGKVLPAGHLAVPRTRAAAAATGDSLLVFSGFGNAGAILSTYEVHGGSGDSGGALELDGVQPRVHATATSLDGGRVVLVGGILEDGRRSAEINVYYPGQNLLCVAGQLNLPRAHHTATRLEDGRILVAGGEGTDGNPMTSAELVDLRLLPSAVASCQEFDTVVPLVQATPVSPLGSARSRHAAIRLANGNVMVAGGFGANGLGVSAIEIFVPEN
jgi:hypothetical protein